ncbi:MAG TPA: aldehyde dehydrogenase family protein [Candidatus Thermoplasmatota archaeon]|nr:aldehyde dehydrogenase family protein [Candidatus Thermoplasmatota archaeon]
MSPAAQTVKPPYREILDALGLPFEHAGCSDGKSWFGSGEWLEVRTPIDGSVIGRVRQATVADYERVIKATHEAYLRWSQVPAPKRGEIVRQIGEELRTHKEALGKLVTLEMGKIVQEGYGEVQEMVDIADFSVGLSRQLYGLTMHSERPGHRMYEQWHPLGVVGVITAFNFPTAVWSWNTLLAAVCGDACVWKPSSKTPLTAIATQQIANRVLAKHGFEGVMTLVIGPGRTVGQRMLDDKRIPLISATGSTDMGFKVYEAVAKRMGRTILELGGNNAIVVTKNADLDLATRAILFGAVGTAGQRCTSTRRVIVHQAVADDLTKRLVKGYGQVKIGSPLESSTLMGPLIDTTAVTDMMEAVAIAQKQGGKLLYGGKARSDLGPNYVEPTLIQISETAEITHQETFAPILYVIPYEGEVQEAIRINNAVPQGLSSAIFTTDLGEAEAFLSTRGSDCGIANVNIGTSGAEIGGAFGGEKETGGGRESGSDSWKQYMRRQTCTINYSKELPLAQGIRFDVQ